MPPNDRAEADSYNLAQSIRQIYINRTSTKIGKRCHLAGRHDREEIWLKAARICIEEKADPSGFVEAAFVHNHVAGGPFSQQLTGNAIRGWWKLYARQMGVQPDGSQKDALEMEVNRDIQHVIRWCLTADDFMEPMRNECLSHFPPYVRCILYPKDVDIIGRFGRAAHAQLSSNPKLLLVLEKLGYDLSFMKGFE